MQKSIFIKNPEMYDIDSFATDLTAKIIALKEKEKNEKLERNP